MYVTTDRDELQRLKLAAMDSAAEFSSNNIAQVGESDGKHLVETVDHISEHNTESN